MIILKENFDKWFNLKVESKARVEVYPLHIPDEQQRSPQFEQLKNFYPVESSYERPNQSLQQQVKVFKFTKKL